MSEAAPGTGSDGKARAGITRRQYELLRHLQGYIAAHGVSPTYRELAGLMGWDGGSAGDRSGGAGRVARMLKLLEAAGYVRRPVAQRRALAILRMPPGLLTREQVAWCHAHADQVQALIAGQAPGAGQTGTQG